MRDRKVLEADFTERTLAVVWGIDSVQKSFSLSPAFNMDSVKMWKERKLDSVK